MTKPPRSLRTISRAAVTLSLRANVVHLDTGDPAEPDEIGLF